MNKPATIVLIIFVCLVPVASAEPDPWRDWNTPGEVRELILSAAARNRLGSDYNSLVWTGRLTPGQQAEYRYFLSELDSRLLAQCRKLFGQNPGKDFSKLPCPRGAAVSAPDAAYIDTTSERTPEEAVAALDAELASELGQYDEMLLEEQEKISSRSPSRSQSSGWGSDAEAESGAEGGEQGESGGGTKKGSRDTSSGEGEWEEYEDESETDSQSDNARSGQPPSARSPGGAAQDEGREPPEDIPDGSDDDVVARQIREAAQKETDPKLRKKLWEEYRRYKSAKR